MTEKKDNLVDGKYSIKDLLDLKKLQQIFEIFTKTTGTTIGLSSYPSQEILIAAGWKDICTKFHRRNPQSAQCCLKSNISMTKNLKKPGDISIVKCGNGMVDGAMPIIIKRKHIATLASGQVFFQPPDLEWFKKQAKKYGYDVGAYLKAVKEVSVVSKDQFKKTLTLLEELATLITHLGYGNLQIAEKNRELEEEIIERRRVEHDVLNANREIELYKRLVEFAGDAVFKHTFDRGEILFANRGFVDLLSLDCAPGQLKGKLLKDLFL